jgi:hypothetical protein
MNATALSGQALRLHLVELLIPHCGPETPAVAAQTLDFILQGEAAAAPKITLAPQAEPESCLPGWASEFLAPEPEPEPELEPEAAPPQITVALSASTEIDMNAVERLYAAGLPQPVIAERLGIAPHKLKKALSGDEIKTRWPRNAAGIPLHPLYPETAPWPPGDDWTNRAEIQTQARDRYQKYAEEGWTEQQIADAENIKLNSVSARMAAFKLTGTWRAAQTPGSSPVEALKPQAVKAPVEIVDNARVDAALAKLNAPPPPRERRPTKVDPTPDAARAELSAHGVAGNQTPTGVPVIKAAPMVWQNPGGPVTVDVIIAWLRHAGDTIIESGKNMWMLNGEAVGASNLLIRANAQRKRLRDPRFGQFQLVKG